MFKKFHLIFLTFLLSIFSFGQNIPQYVPTDSLVGWWPFTGNAIDSSGYGNCRVNVVDKDILTVSADYIRYITRITPAISEFYIRSRLDFDQLRLTVSVGYKSTLDFVTFTKINYKGNYLIVTTQMNNSDNQLGYFSGNFLGIGMSLDRRIEKNDI